MTLETSWGWIAYATRRADVRSLLNLDDDQALVLGELLSKAPFVNPNQFKPKPKKITFTCQCGCGETVTSTFTTVRPKYKPEHKKRVSNRNYYHRKVAELRAKREQTALLKGGKP